MNSADCFEEWAEAAMALDKLERRKSFSLSKIEEASLGKRTQFLQSLIAESPCDLHGLAWAIRQDLGEERLGKTLAETLRYSNCHFVEVPCEIEEYTKTINQALMVIASSSEVGLEERVEFFRTLRHSHGRTAILLSGGGSFGHFHFGVTRALTQAGLLPNLLAGASAGSIGAALLATRTDAEIKSTIDTWIHSSDNDFYGAPKSAYRMFLSLFKTGSIHSIEEYIVRLQRLFGNLTFKEAFQRTGRVLCVSVSPADSFEPPKLLNYLTFPRVLVWSAIACSSAFPFLFHPQQLLAKDSQGNIVPYHLTGMVRKDQSWENLQNARLFADGSLESDLPMSQMRELFNVNFFLVSQCNPYLVPIMGIRNMLPVKFWFGFEVCILEIKHRLQQLRLFWPRSRLLKLLCQPWQGDINFLLPMDAFPLLQSAVNFSPKEIKEAMMHGQQAVWRVVRIVEEASAVERCILEHLTDLTHEIRVQNRLLTMQGPRPLERTKSSIPSWLDLRASLGLPSSASNDSMAQDGEHVGNSNVSFDIKSDACEPKDEQSVLEGGISAWRDICSLTMGMDVIAP